MNTQGLSNGLLEIAKKYEKMEELARENLQEKELSDFLSQLRILNEAEREALYKKKADYDERIEVLNPSRPPYYIEELDARGPH